ncbi:MAG TPA: electron transport complex subunit RsxC [Acidobacteriota bacterium]|nr:electron transport complex subunit RsxC [Acidobacteriota bacterium]
MATANIELRTFGRGGIHPDTHKRDTAVSPIETMAPLPSEVWLPLSQHLGEPAVPLVKKGDKVVRGQKIAEGGATGAPLHATISGKVKPIDKRPHPTLVSVESIIIARDGEAEQEFPDDPDWRSLPREAMLERIREAGIVGLGGAAFPTYRKLTLPPGVKVDTFILNGAECEPYLTSDHRLMLEEPEAIVEGALAMARLIGVKRVLVGIEADKLPAVESLRAAARNVPMGEQTFEVVPCEVRYPQGAERQLVTALTGRVIPPRSLPTAVGVLVQNVATAHAVHQAIRSRRPLLDRVMTVTGPGIFHPRNLRVPIGTLLQTLVDACGGMRPDTSRLIAGGPMMGRALPRLDLPVIKGMNGLLLLTGRGPMEEGFGPCIQCGRCLDACPLGLEPDQVSVRVEAGRTLDTDPYGPLDCYECGCCTYVCPSGRPLLQFMQVAKSALRRAVEVKVKV